MISVVVVDDDPLVRGAVRDMLAPESDIEIVAHAANCAEALAAIEGLRPDVVLMDLHMPGADGVETTRQLRALDPSTRVLVFAIHRCDEDVHRALQAGALGFVVKGDPPEQLRAAIRLVAAGGAVLAAPTGRVLAAYVTPSLTADVRARVSRLTPREREVLAHIANGQSNAQTASAMSISTETVKHHVTQILGKLGCNRVQAAMIAGRAEIGTISDGERPPPKVP